MSKLANFVKKNKTVIIIVVIILIVVLLALWNPFSNENYIDVPSVRSRVEMNLSNFPQKWTELNATSRFTIYQIEMVAKKYAPMCVYDKNEEYWASSVDFHLEKSYPEYMTDPSDWITNTENAKKVYLNLEEADNLVRDNPTDIIPHFYGTSNLTPNSNFVSGKESRNPAYCQVVLNSDGGMDLVYNLFFPYNYGKSACVGVNVSGIGSSAANFFTGRGEQFRYRRGWNPFNSSGWDWAKDAVNTVGSGLEKAWDWTKDAANTVGSGLEKAGGYIKGAGDALINTFRDGCLGKTYRFGNHIGDIEGCRIRLNSDLKPIEVYFGAHDFDMVMDLVNRTLTDKKTGNVLATNYYPTFVNDQGLVDSNPSKNTHLILYLAWGSHGTWQSPGDHEYTPEQKGFAKVATTLSQLKLVDNTSSLEEGGIPWMTWKDLVTLVPEEWSGERPLPSALDKYGITNWVTQVGRWGNQGNEPDGYEKVAGNKRLEAGPSGFKGKYGNYVGWGNSLKTKNLNNEPAKKCTGYDCSIEGQYCLPGSEGASGKTWKCINKRWTEQSDSVNLYKPPNLLQEECEIYALTGEEPSDACKKMSFDAYYKKSGCEGIPDTIYNKIQNMDWNSMKNYVNDISSFYNQHSEMGYGGFESDVDALVNKLNECTYYPMDKQRWRMQWMDNAQRRSNERIVQSYLDIINNPNASEQEKQYANMGLARMGYE